MEELQYMAHLQEGGWTLDQVRARYEDRRDAQRRQTALDFSISNKLTGEIVGDCGFKNVNLIHKNAEFGLIIHHPFWGKGVCAECHLLCFDYAFSVLMLHRIMMKTFVTNVRMRGFFEKIGIKQEGIKKECFFHNGKFFDDAVYTKNSGSSLDMSQFNAV
ncbi:MAG: hypothetical protein A3I05_08235 [Deltaproteobacteria bacterium RIFCSPLOWO2_02_FULL_44_10]|nr:MAG: hypothetical protein A3I05_08235 [Deltaproteobacteria bacterium RIFCSPLOWO2_02_FULL_44_10]